jgi:thymidine kinase
MKGYLSITIGPMFSGKTNSLIKKYNSFEKTEKLNVVINYAYDKRYSETMLSSHDLVMIPCIMVKTLYEIYKNENHGLVTEADNIFINEAQFFPDLYEFVLDMIQKNKNIYLYGLDGDYTTNKIGRILDLIPKCNDIVKLNAICEFCNEDAIFTYRKSNEKEQIVIGNDNYMPLCRSCYYNETNKNN